MHEVVQAGDGTCHPQVPPSHSGPGESRDGVEKWHQLERQVDSVNDIITVECAMSSTESVLITPDVVPVPLASDVGSSVIGVPAERQQGDAERIEKRSGTSVVSGCSDMASVKRRSGVVQAPSEQVVSVVGDLPPTTSSVQCQASVPASSVPVTSSSPVTVSLVPVPLSSVPAQGQGCQRRRLMQCLCRR